MDIAISIDISKSSNLCCVNFRHLTFQIRCDKLTFYVNSRDSVRREEDLSIIHIIGKSLIFLFCHKRVD